MTGEKDKKTVEQLLETAKQSLSSNACKDIRKTAKVKILCNLKNMPITERNNAIDGLLNILSETEDPCLQNYLVDILIFQCLTEVDNRLLQVISSSNGRIADFVKIYAVSMLSGGKYENIYRG